MLQENVPAVSIDGHETVPANDEDALLKAVANQPVSVAIDAGGSDFQFYSEVNKRMFPLYWHMRKHDNYFWRESISGKYISKSSQNMFSSSMNEKGQYVGCQSQEICYY